MARNINPCAGRRKGERAGCRGPNEPKRESSFGMSFYLGVGRMGATQINHGSSGNWSQLRPPSIISSCQKPMLPSVALNDGGENVKRC